jgi:hypothetical protein
LSKLILFDSQARKLFTFSTQQGSTTKNRENKKYTKKSTKANKTSLEKGYRMIMAGARKEKKKKTRTGTCES